MIELRSSDDYLVIPFKWIHIQKKGITLDKF